MIFGFNTDVTGRDGVYHVQTEDRGTKNPVVESVVYVGGKIIAKRRTSYSPAEATAESGASTRTWWKRSAAVSGFREDRMVERRRQRPRATRSNC